jgi:hypothetical protein
MAPPNECFAVFPKYFTWKENGWRKCRTVGVQIVQARVDRVIVGIHHRKAKPWFSPFNVSKAHHVGNKGDLTQNG